MKLALLAATGLLALVPTDPNDSCCIPYSSHVPPYGAGCPAGVITWYWWLPDPAPTCTAQDVPGDAGSSNNCKTEEGKFCSAWAQWTIIYHPKYDCEAQEVFIPSAEQWTRVCHWVQDGTEELIIDPACYNSGNSGDTLLPGESDVCDS